MVELAHEIWEDADGLGFEFGLPHPTKDSFRANHEPNARLVGVIYGNSQGAAMIAYYQWQGWGEYLNHGFEDVSYTQDQLDEQLRFRPSLYALPNE